MLFEWDESKRQANLAKHLVDFQDATQIFDGPVFEKARRRAHRDERKDYANHLRNTGKGSHGF